MPVVMGYGDTLAAIEVEHLEAEAGEIEGSADVVDEGES